MGASTQDHFIHVTLFTCMQFIVEAPIPDQDPIDNLYGVGILIRLGLNSYHTKKDS
jgi:hypothetical protein